MNKNIEDELELELEDMENEDIEKKSKREVAGNQENITNINNYIRFVTMSDGNRRLERLKKYTDGTESFIFEGWYGNRDDSAMFRNVIALIRDNKLKEQQVSDLKYYIKCFEEAKNEIINYFNVEF